MKDAYSCAQRQALKPADLVELRKLTPQQLRVFLLIGKALTNKAIAQELNIAETTVKAHVSVIFKLARCRNRVEAALLAHRMHHAIPDDVERLNGEASVNNCAS
ncbi:MAG: response regulator transcription factor [Hyphomicrobium sp.]